jgi:hypothetical protein
MKRIVLDEQVAQLCQSDADSLVAVDQVDRCVTRELDASDDDILAAIDRMFRLISLTGFGFFHFLDGRSLGRDDRRAAAANFVAEGVDPRCVTKMTTSRPYF